MPDQAAIKTKAREIAEMRIGDPDQLIDVVDSKGLVGKIPCWRFYEDDAREFLQKNAPKPPVETTHA